MTKQYADCPSCGRSLENLPGFKPAFDARPYCGPDCAGVATHGNEMRGHKIAHLLVTEHPDGRIEVGGRRKNSTVISDTAINLESAR